MAPKKLLTIGLIVLCLFLVNCSSGSGKYNDFAQCLTESGAKMYGAYWCSHCKDQKAMFEDSWEYVNYVECSLPGGNGQTEVCQQEGITGYPTWEFADGSRVSGAIPFEKLSYFTGCELSN